MIGGIWEFYRGFFGKICKIVLYFRFEIWKGGPKMTYNTMHSIISPFDHPLHWVPKLLSNIFPPFSISQRLDLTSLEYLFVFDQQHFFQNKEALVPFVTRSSFFFCKRNAIERTKEKSCKTRDFCR